VSAAECRQLRLVTGVDMYMDKYPDYNGKLMPTGLSCGGGLANGRGDWCAGCASTAVLLSPDGKALLLASPQALDSYQLEYESGGGGHRIRTLSWDCINAVDPRPDNYHTSTPQFQAGESREWLFYVAPLEAEGPPGERGAAAADRCLDDAIGCAVVGLLGKPCAIWGGWPARTRRELLVYADASQEVDGLAENANLRVWPAGSAPESPGGAAEAPLAMPRRVSAPGSGAEVVLRRYWVEPKVLPQQRPQELFGLTLFYRSAGITRSTAAASVCFPWRSWSWYLGVCTAFIRKFVPPKCGISCEQYMGAMALAAEQRFGAPSRSQQQYLEDFVEHELMQVAFDRKTGAPFFYPSRIQNISCAMDICRLTYLAALAQPSASGGPAERWLGYAWALAGALLESQAPGGGLFNGNVLYTCVYYPAKSLMDLADCLRAHGRASDADWLQGRIRLCLADLLKRGDNLDTEGEATYEDGAIACCALQLAQWFRATGDEAYLRAAQKIAAGHRCLEFRSANARTNGATVRFWEACYGMGYGLCLNTPHGWSAWTGHMHYQLYLATADLFHLFRFMDNLMAILAGLVSPDDNGIVYYTYTPDPTITDFNGRRVAGDRPLPMRAGEALREIMTNEPFEVVKLLNDTLLEHVHVFWHEGRWCAIGAEISEALPEEDGGWQALEPRASTAAPAEASRATVAWVNPGGSAADRPHLDLAPLTDAGLQVQFLRARGDATAGPDCGDGAWLIV